MAGSLVVLARQSPLNGGVTVPGAQCFVYDATTTTKRSIYTTSALSVAHTNPVVADANGRFAAIWIDSADGGYKIVLAPEDDTDPPTSPFWTEDNIPVATATAHDISTDTEPGFFVYSNYATANKQANITSITYGVSGGGTFHANHANGTYASPSATLSGEITGGIGSRAYHSGGAFQTSSPASIHWQATENQTATNYGMWIRILTTPQGTTTRQERGGFTDLGTVWMHDTGTFNTLTNAQTRPFPDALFTASASGALAGAAYAAVGYGAGPVTAGFRGGSARGTPGTPTATQSGDLVVFLGGHGYGATAWSAAAKGIFGVYASQAWTDANQGTYATVEVTPLSSTTRAEVARFDASTTATHTRFMIYDVDNGTVERVTVGAADSGGAGFKVLRIPN